MSNCSHNHSRSFTVFPSCKFREITDIYCQGRADVICGFLESSELTQKVAVKGFLLARGNEKRLIENELTVWRLLSPHPNIASFLGTAPTDRYRPCYMSVGSVSDYYANGNLSQYLGKVDPDRTDYLRRIELLIGVARGIQHIHELSIVHGDLKAANAVVDMEGRLAKICDFGSSIIDCVCYESPKDQAGTIPWDSPELYMEEDVVRTTLSDVWAFGCVALEVQMGVFPWDPEGNIDRVMARQIRGGHPAKTEWLNLGENKALRQSWELMKECWQELPSRRPSVKYLILRLGEISEEMKRSFTTD